MNNGFLRSVLVYPCPPPSYENYADWNTIPYAEENFTAAYPSLPESLPESRQLLPSTLAPS